MTRYALLAFLLFFALACTDDDAAQNNPSAPGLNNPMGVTCPEGQVYNPVLGQCIATEGMEPEPEPVECSPGKTFNTETMRCEQLEPLPEPDMTMMEPDMMMMGPDDMGPPPRPDMGPPPDVCGVGSIIGKACAPSGEILGAATVTITGVDCATGMPFTQTVTTSGDGTYSLPNISSGMHEVTIESGSFARTFPVQVRADQELDLTRQASKVCLEANAVKIAVLSGNYDDVEGVLDDLGLQYDIKGDDTLTAFFPTPTQGFRNSVAFLKDPAAMAQYDVIFINCGDLWNGIQNFFPGDVTAIVGNLRQYVLSGKSVYASDWAHQFLEQSLPDAIDFLGNDTETQEAQDGFAPQVIMANVESPALQTVLGMNTVAIDFPHNPPTLINNNWVMIEGTGMATTVHLRGDAGRCADSTGGLGSPQCTTQDGTLPGAPLLVSYKDPTSGGTIAFTSFHNHAEGAAVSPDILKILKFLIFQL